MNYVKSIVCFANSQKTSGRCIAGKEWMGGRPSTWIRPVSARHSHEISEEGQQDGNSLFLIHLDSAWLVVGQKAPEYPDSKPAVQAVFCYRGINYMMDVTDPVIERSFCGDYVSGAF